VGYSRSAYSCQHSSPAPVPVPLLVPTAAAAVVFSSLPKFCTTPEIIHPSFQHPAPTSSSTSPCEINHAWTSDSESHVCRHITVTPDSTSGAHHQVRTDSKCSKFVTIRIYDIMIPPIHHGHHCFPLKSILSSYLTLPHLLCVHLHVLSDIVLSLDYLFGIVIFSRWIIV
jgi:hypothetical protein